MKKNLKFCCAFLPFASLGFTCLSSCSFSDDCKIQNVVAYYNANRSRLIPIRFFSEMPNVPYVGVNQFFHEFFETDMIYEKNGDTYTYYHPNNPNGDFLCFTKGAQNTFMTSGLESFGVHPRSISATSKTFLSIADDGADVTSKSIFTATLNNYSIKIHGDNNDAYVPLTFLSDIIGPHSGYNIAYNGKNIYVLDFNGFIQGMPCTYNTYFGDGYFNELSNFETERPADLAKYVYNQLCFTFDNLRGYTNQLVFGDNSLISIGLNGVLEAYYPHIKEYLLSTDKAKYLQGLQALFSGLYDGGHTAILSPQNSFRFEEDLNHPRPPQLQQIGGEFAKAFDNPDFTDRKNIDPNNISTNVCRRTFLREAFSSMVWSLANWTKKFDFGLSTLSPFNPEGNYNPTNGFYYKVFPDQKIAFIGFDKFNIAFGKWDQFYNSQGAANAILSELVKIDTYAFVRDKLIQAKKDGVTKVILDISTNSGGIVMALAGIVGLFNAAKCEYNVNNVLNNFHTVTNFIIDVNLDGQYNEEDCKEAQKMIEGLQIGVLTSNYSFSCGNLLPIILKEIGLPIIGQKSGGGSCAIMMCSTADGIPYSHSSYSCLSDSNGNNVDTGVIPDIEISPYIITIDDKRVPIDMDYLIAKNLDLDYMSPYIENAGIDHNYFSPIWISEQLDNLPTKN